MTGKVTFWEMRCRKASLRVKAEEPTTPGADPMEELCAQPLGEKVFTLNLERARPKSRQGWRKESKAGSYKSMGRSVSAPKVGVAGRFHCPNNSLDILIAKKL